MDVRVSEKDHTLTRPSSWPDMHAFHLPTLLTLCCLSGCTDRGVTLDSLQSSASRDPIAETETDTLGGEDSGMTASPALLRSVTIEGVAALTGASILPRWTKKTSKARRRSRTVESIRPPGRTGNNLRTLLQHTHAGQVTPP